MTAAAPTRVAPPAPRTRSAPARSQPASPRQAATSAPLRAAQVAEPVRSTTASRTVFALIVGGILVGGLVALLLLHTLAAQDGFAVHRMSQQLATLTDQEQQQMVDLEQLQSPQELQQRAAALGMRPSVVTSYQRMHDGRVVALAEPSLPPVAAVTTAPTSKATQSKRALSKRASAKSGPASRASSAAGHRSATPATATSGSSGAGAPAKSRQVPSHQHIAGQSTSRSTTHHNG